MEQGSSRSWWNCLQRRIPGVALLSVLSAPALESAAQTTVHRCVTPGGGIEFRQHACADGSDEKALTIEDRKSGWVPPKVQAKGTTKDKKDRRKRQAVTRANAAEARREEQCWKKRQLLEEINWKLRRGYKPGQGVKLRHRRRAYEDYIGRYCD